MANSASPVHPDIIDGSSLFGVTKAAAARMQGAKVTVDYGALNLLLDEVREDRGWQLATRKTVLLATDPMSASQKRFTGMLHHSGFTVDEVDYRAAYVSPPPDDTMDGASSESIPKPKPVESLTARLCYILGLLSRHDDVQVLVVSHSFELHGPLTNLAQRMPQGRVGLAYFRTLLDKRWRGVDLGEAPGRSEGSTALHFIDLEPYAKRLLGVDPFDADAGPRSARASLSEW